MLYSIVSIATANRLASPLLCEQKLDGPSVTLWIVVMRQNRTVVYVHHTSKHYLMPISLQRSRSCVDMGKDRQTDRQQ